MWTDRWTSAALNHLITIAKAGCSVLWTVILPQSWQLFISTAEHNNHCGASSSSRLLIFWWSFSSFDLSVCMFLVLFFLPRSHTSVLRAQLLSSLSVLSFPASLPPSLLPHSLLSASWASHGKQLWSRLMQNVKSESLRHGRTLRKHKTPCVKSLDSAGTGSRPLTGQRLIWALQTSGFVSPALPTLNPRWSQNWQEVLCLGFHI